MSEEERDQSYVRAEAKTRRKVHTYSQSHQYFVTLLLVVPAGKEEGAGLGAPSTLTVTGVWAVEAARAVHWLAVPMACRFCWKEPSTTLVKRAIERAV